MKLSDKVDLWMDRFQARTDVFGQIYTKIIPEKKKPEKRVSPVYVEKYRDKKLRQATEFNSVEELYVPLTKKEVEAHIRGSKELMIYLPRREDGTTNFFAVDFDFQHGFKETQRVAKALEYHKIPHAIARSTTKGHHIYVFFDGPIESFYITNYMDKIFTELGYMDKIKNDDIVGTNEKGQPILWTNPEVFPKVITIGDNVRHTGNGIKPALHYKGLEHDQCCFVDYNNKVIGGSGLSEKQWEYLEKVPKLNVSKFKKLIEDLNIEVDEDMRLSEKRGAVKDMTKKRALPYKQPEDGDLMLVVNGCPAFKRIWQMPVKDMPHFGRVALLAMALKCKNGVELIREKFGDSAETNRQITWAMETNQQPWCCKTLQDYDICIKGRDPLKATGSSISKSGDIDTDYCYEKSPPREMINGRIKVNPKNLPEEEWPWPSPIRNRVPFQKKGVQPIKKEIDKLSKDDPELDDKLEILYKKIVSVRDKKAKDELNEYLKSKKLTTNKNLKHFEKIALQQKKEDAERVLDSQGGFRSSNDVRYAVIDGGGYSIVRLNNEGEDEYVTISNFEIELLLDVKEHPIIGPEQRWFEGTIKCKNRTHKFKIKSDDYSNNTKLAAMLFSCIGPEADFKNSNLEYIRSAAALFGIEKLRVINTYEDYGFDNDKKPTLYRTTSGQITADGYDFGDKEDVVDLSKSQFGKYLGMVNLDKSELKHVVSVLKNNVLKMQDEILTVTTIAHSLQSLIHNVYIPLNNSPILWMVGLTGMGKSKIAEMAQQLHGDFKNVCSIDTTQRSIETYGMLFKDSMLLLDDYKKDLPCNRWIVGFVQKTYDRSERGRLNSDRTQSETLSARGLYCVTAEDPPTTEASVMARLVYIEGEKLLEWNKDEKENYKVCQEVKDKLSGISAAFIQYMLAKYPDPKVFHDKFYQVQEALSIGVGVKQNAPRIISNLAANYLTWEVFLDFLLEEGLIVKEYYNESRMSHMENIKTIRDEMLIRCSNEQGSNVFLSILRQALASGEYRIDGTTNHNPNAKIIGFIDDKEEENILYLYTDMAYRAVKKIVRESEGRLGQSKESIGKQMRQDGVIVKSLKNSTLYKKTYKGNRSYVWAINPEKAGLLVSDDVSQIETVKDNVLTLPVDRM